MGQKPKRIRQKKQKDQTEKAKGSDRKSSRTRQKNKRGDNIIEKWDQTEIPEIPDWGGDIRNPRPPFRGLQQ